MTPETIATLAKQAGARTMVDPTNPRAKPHYAFRQKQLAKFVALALAESRLQEPPPCITRTVKPWGAYEPKEGQC